MSRRTHGISAAALMLVSALTSAAPAMAAPRPIAQAAQARVAALPSAALAQATTSEANNMRSFIRTKKGALATVFLAAALGWTFVSFSNDRVKSPLK